MVRRISGKPVIQFHFSSDGNTVDCSLSVKLKRLDLRSEAMVFATSLWDREVVSRLAELGPKFESSRKALVDVREKGYQIARELVKIDRERRAIDAERSAFDKERARIEGTGGVFRSDHLYSPAWHSPYEHKKSEYRALQLAHQANSKEVMAVESVARDAQSDLAGIQKRLAEPQFVREIPNGFIPLDGSSDGHEYALRQGILWSCTHKLEPQQWQALIARHLEKESAKLAAALGGDSSTSGRERISPEVRRAVWIRDGGCCARCRSRERLEYDHIIAVSLGGGNTERNIELLCEVCNRSKSNKIQ